MVKQVGYYPLKGCYNSTISTTKTSSPLLSAASTSLPTTLSAEKCVGYCATKGYSVAGAESDKCLCGPSLSSNAEELDLSACNVRCSGNKREFCGAEDKVLVWVMDVDSVDSTTGAPKSMGEKNEATVKPSS